MRAQEFILEYRDDDDDQTAHRDGLDLESIQVGSDFQVTASSHDRRLARVMFKKSGNTLIPRDLSVEEQYRGQGIAAVMYDWVKELGYKIQRSPDQSPAGKRFWDKNRGEEGMVWEAEQRMMEPELYEDVPPSILKRAVQAALPGVQLAFRTTPEGYLNVTNDDDSVVLDIGMSIYDSELSFNIKNAYLTKHAKGGVMTNIIATAFKLAEKKYGIPRSRSLSINQDRSYGVWQRIADKLGLEYSAHRIGENFADGQKTILEYRDRMYQYIKSMVPTWPDYVVKDWLYANFARGNVQTANYSFDTLGKDLPKILADTGLTVDTKWQLVPNMKFTMDIWEPKTLKRLQARAGGSSKSADPEVHIPARDAERHATQAALAKQQGGIRKEPVIIIKTPQGYELLEGWHRTIQHFAQYPDGYTGPAYVATAGAVQENFADGRVKGKSRPGRVKRAGASCSGSVTSLRAKARKYGGEKGKMYHWCANMKSGRAKNESELDEDWRSALAGAAATGALAFGMPGAVDAKPTPVDKPAVTAKAVSPKHAPVSRAEQAKMSPIEKLKLAAKSNGIHGTELAQFLAQCAHESANFTRMEEIGRPEYFAKKYDPKYAPKTAKILGNTEAGDGERYKGRGFIQLTGRDNYRMASKALNLPLEANPDLAARPDVAALVAVWYWKNRVANKVKNFHNTKQVTKAINPAGKGLQSRQDQFKSFQVAMR